MLKHKDKRGIFSLSCFFNYEAGVGYQELSLNLKL